MSVPAEIMQMQNQPGPQAQPPDAGADTETSGAAPPAPSPASQPTAQEGSKVLAETNVQTAVTLLMAALPHYQVGSDEYLDLLDAMKKLSRRFGAHPGQALVPSQVMEMARAVQAGQPPAPPGAAQ